MCKCTPNNRTPFCGKPGCEWPKLPDVTIPRERYQVLAKELRALHIQINEQSQRIAWIAGELADLEQMNTEG